MRSFRPFKAIAALFFSILWFYIICMGILVLVVPQLTLNAYGKNVDIISKWIRLMDYFFDSFKEL